LLEVDFFDFVGSASPVTGPASRRTSTEGLGIEIPLLYVTKTIVSNREVLQYKW
jgi:hypothetical protein